MRTLIQQATALAMLVAIGGCEGSHPHQTADSGSPGNPFVTTYCRTAEPKAPEPSYLTIGAVSLPAMADLGDAYQPTPDEHGVTFYKGGVEIRPDYPAVTVTIGAAARSYARIENESYQGPLADGALSITYAGRPRTTAENDWTCWYVGGYNLLDRRTTACLPLDVTIAGDPAVHHVTVPIGRKCAETTES